LQWRMADGGYGQIWRISAFDTALSVCYACSIIRNKATVAILNMICLRYNTRR
jgi:hypothetical protein